MPIPNPYHRIWRPMKGYSLLQKIVGRSFTDAEMYDFIWDDSKGVKVAVQNYTF